MSDTSFVWYKHKLEFIQYSKRCIFVSFRYWKFRTCKLRPEGTTLHLYWHFEGAAVSALGCENVSLCGIARGGAELCLRAQKECLMWRPVSERP